LKSSQPTVLLTCHCVQIYSGEPSVIFACPTGSLTAIVPYLVVVAMLAVFPLQPSLKAAGDDWPMAFHDPSHSGRSTEVVIPPLALAWTWRDTAAYDNDSKWNLRPYPWLPIFYHGRLYIQGGMNANRLFALDPSNGNVLWEADNPGYTSNGNYLFQFANYPAAVKGRILNASTDFTASVDAANGADQHVVYNTNGGWPFGGTALWNRRAIFQFVETDNGFEDLKLVTDPVKLSVAGPYVKPNGGTTLTDYGFRVPAVDNNVVYANRLGQLVAWDPGTATDLWTWGTRNFGASPAVWNHILYFYASSQKMLAAIPTAPMVATSYALGGVPVLWTATVAGAYAPVASDGVVYAGSSDRNFYALDAQTGAVRWKFATGAAFSPLQIPAISGSAIYVPGADGVLYAINKDTGQEVWHYTGTAAFGPVVISGGRVFVSDMAFGVYGFTPASAAVGPSVSSLSIARVTSGSVTPITVSGSGFTGATAVQLDDAAHTSITGFKVADDATLTGAMLPASVAPGRYHVNVTTSTGSSVDGPELEVAPAGSFLRNFVGLSQGPYDHGTDHPFQRHLVRLNDGTLLATYSGRRLYSADGADVSLTYHTSRDGGRTWSAALAFDTGGPDTGVIFAASFGVSAGPSNRIHLIFEQWPSYRQALGAYDYDGSDFLASSPMTPSYISAQPTLPGPSVTDPMGRVWVGYALGSDVYASYSADGGFTWTQTPRISQAASGPPALVMFAGAPLVVYGQNGALVWSAWNGTQWSAPQSLPGSISGVNDNLSLTTTADGRVHVAAAGSAGLQYLNFNGTAWSAPIVLDAEAAMPSITTNGVDLWCFYATATKNIAYRRWRADIGSWDAAVWVTNDALNNTRPAALALSPDSTVPVIWTVGSAIPYEIHSAVIPVQSAPAALEADVFATPRLVWGMQGGLVVSVLGGQPPYSVDSMSQISIPFTRAGNYHFPITVRDANGATSTASAEVSVAQVPTTVTVSLPTGPLEVNSAYSLTAAVADQFGNAMALPPAVIWSLPTSGPRGVIDGSGNFSAQESGVFKVTANVPDGPSGFLTVNVLPPESLPPILSNITRSAITQNSATVQWTTNEPTDSQVEYGFNTSYGNLSPLTTTLTTAHTITLTGLTPGRVYHYRLHSKSAGGKDAMSPDLMLTTLRPSKGGPGR
jgi:outer membrane protein assembly factor BamB